MIKRYIISIIMLLFFSGVLIAQKEANHWIFGDSTGLNFNDDSEGEVIFSHIYAPQGCAVISDRLDGSLLFYSNGETVWDRKHQIMPHGQNLFGSKEATQSALIVPFPGDNMKYYLFTLSTSNIDSYSRLHYSIVDMELNEGLGDVIDSCKNILLDDELTEKITAIPHPDNDAYWILTHKANCNIFYIYYLDQQGINEEVVHQDIGNNNFSDEEDFYAAKGYIKASPDGSMVACAVSSQSQYKQLELYNFDSKNGILFDYRVIDSLIFQYGLSFSPDNSKLYIQGINKASKEGDTDILHQYDLNAMDIGASRVGLIRENPFLTIDPYQVTWSIFALQITPGGAIYGAADPSTLLSNESKSMIKISNPNQKGYACGIDIADIVFEHSVMLGLPNFMEHYFNGINPEEIMDICRNPNSMELFPNPVNNYLNLNIAEGCYEPYKLVIYNVLGQKLLQFQISKQKIELSVHNLSSGTYLAMFIFSNRQFIRKFVKIG